MNSSEQIVCKPTPWFTLRAVAMLAMFSVFAVLFYIDGTTGYRKKNFTYFVHATFEEATTKFSAMNSDNGLTKQEWEDFASQQTVDFGNDPSILPVDLERPMPWPDVLIDYDRIKSLQHNLLWTKYSGKQELNENPPEKIYDKGTIQEQIVVFYICLGLSVITLAILIRTSRRSIIADEHSIKTARGRQIPYENMKILDLRKWETKGIARIEYDAPTGSGSARIDGLTYGGFKKDRNEPAERLMRKIKEHFSGEIIEYTSIEENPSEGSVKKPESPV
jgi:hypothetical protein